MMGIEEFYVRATGHRPFPYQAALATGVTLPDVLAVPTGAGKTAARAGRSAAPPVVGVAK